MSRKSPVDIIMGRYKADFVDEHAVWSVSTQTKQQINARQKNGSDISSGWGHGAVVNSIVKHPKLSSIIKGHANVIQLLFSSHNKQHNMDVDNLFEENSDVQDSKGKEEEEEEERGYLEQSPQKKQKLSTTQSNTKQKQQVRVNETATIANYKLPKTKTEKQKEKLIEPFEQFVEHCHENGQNGKIGMVPKAYQKTIRRNNLDQFKQKVADSETYDACKRFYDFLKSKGYVA